MKYGIIAIVIATIISNHNKIDTQTKIPNKPIALVKYKDAVYQCQGVVSTECGYSIHCGNMSVHCVDKLTIEYLN